ncbi:flavin reductase family protein [Clostridium fermenticellae]|uniref:Flavin reductase family protein n=1 Tax=Clostridium fermenticellae TaxID=2068654 RepID=A0A386H253_9CLOT|nr:flavin reductase family protein [Clostridium fermenticellae]AYD39734.1 flavin reductase family protein [Clostridium fermenticellae]
MSKMHFKGSSMLNPVPAVLITSMDKGGNKNVFTVGWIGSACTHPPMLTVAIRPERLSYKYIKESYEFVINMPSSKMTKIVDFCGVTSGRNINKIDKCNIKLEDSTKIKTPSIEECPINIECRVKRIIPLGSHELFLAEVLAVSVDENLIDENGKIRMEEAELICYSHGEYFNLPKRSLGKFGYSIQKKKSKYRNKK